MSNASPCNESSLAVEKDEVGGYVLSGKEGLRDSVEEEVTELCIGQTSLLCEGKAPVPMVLCICVL